MIIDGNKLIRTPVRTILEALQCSVQLHNINKLRSVEYKQNNARITCPSHKDGQEHTPSCDVLLEDKIVNGKTVPAGTVHCFACGYKANIVKLVADCLDISYSTAINWLLGFVQYDLVTNVSRDVSFDESAQQEVKDVYADIPAITVEQLKKYEYVHPYMFQRKFNDWAINKFDIGYDPDSNSLTFPVYVDSKCIFVAKRNVSTKYFELPKITPKPIYGIDYLTNNEEVLVCESVIDAITCWIYGRQAVALFGTGSDTQIKQLQELPQRSIVLALDGDEYGDKGARRIAKALNNKIVSRLVIPTGKKDINDLSKEEFNNCEEVIM